MHKRWLCLAAAAVMALSMTACGKDKENVSSAAVSSEQNIGNYQSMAGVPFEKGVTVTQESFEKNYKAVLASTQKSIPDYLKLPAGSNTGNSVAYAFNTGAQLDTITVTLSNREDGTADRLTLNFITESEAYDRSSFNTLAALLFASLRGSREDYDHFLAAVAKIEREQTFPLEDTEVYISFETFDGLIVGQAEFRFAAQ